MGMGPFATPPMKLGAWIHRRQGFKSGGNDILILNTVGARTGKPRVNPLGSFPDPDPASRIVVASNAGSAKNPGWYYNLKAHPDQVWIESSEGKARVTATRLDGDERQTGWNQVVTIDPRYKKYETKTERVIPVIRLSRVSND